MICFEREMKAWGRLHQGNHFSYKAVKIDQWAWLAWPHPPYLTPYQLSYWKAIFSQNACCVAEHYTVPFPSDCRAYWFGETWGFFCWSLYLSNSLLNRWNPGFLISKDSTLAFHSTLEKEPRKSWSTTTLMATMTERTKSLRSTSMNQKAQTNQWQIQQRMI